MALHMHVDDTQLYCFYVKSTNDPNNSLSVMTHCVEDVRVWMTQSLLIKRDEDKTESLVLSSPYYRDSSLKVEDAAISGFVQCHNLGCIFDSKCDMK